MKVVILVLVLMFGVLCVADLGEDWDSFDGNDSGSSSVGVDVKIGSPVVEDVGEYSDGERYTLEFYIALGVGAVGVLIVAVFVYFFLRKPKNKWEKREVSKG